MGLTISSADVSGLMLLCGQTYDVQHWVANNIYSLTWDSKKNMLFHCSGSGMPTYDTVQKCPFLECRNVVFDRDNKGLILELLANHYGIILPINTMLMGITRNPFYHDVFLLKEENKDIMVYDFWPPHFQWAPRSFCVEDICGAINHAICREPQAIAIRQRPSIPCRLSSLIKDQTHSYLSNYNSANSGANVYYAICEYINQLDDVFTLDHTIFHILIEHFEIWNHLLESQDKLFLNHENIYGELIQLKNDALVLRNMSMKYWRKYSHTASMEWKTLIIQKLLSIREKEVELLKYIGSLIDSSTIPQSCPPKLQ